MINTKKLLGIFVGLAGVFISRYPLWSDPSPGRALGLRVTGVAIACVGIALFASGIHKKTDTKVRICPHCFLKNSATRENCIRCKKPLNQNP